VAFTTGLTEAFVINALPMAKIKALAIIILILFIKKYLSILKITYSVLQVFGFP